MKSLTCVTSLLEYHLPDVYVRAICSYTRRNWFPVKPPSPIRLAVRGPIWPADLPIQVEPKTNTWKQHLIICSRCYKSRNCLTWNLENWINKSQITMFISGHAYNNLILLTMTSNSHEVLRMFNAFIFHILQF